MYTECYNQEQCILFGHTNSTIGLYGSLPMLMHGVYLDCSYIALSSFLCTKHKNLFFSLSFNV